MLSPELLDVDGVSCLLSHGLQNAVVAELSERIGIVVSVLCMNLRRRLERHFSFADLGGLCPALFGQFLEHNPVANHISLLRRFNEGRVGWFCSCSSFGDFGVHDWVDLGGWDDVN